MRKRRSRLRAGRRGSVLLYGATAGLSVNRLLQGQLAYMQEKGWDVHVASSPGPEFTIAHTREGITAHDLGMSREIEPLRDNASLAWWMTLLIQVRAAVSNVSAPKRGLRLEGTSGRKRDLRALTEQLTAWLSTEVGAISHSLAEAFREEKLVRADRPLHVIGAGSSNGVAADAVRSASTLDETLQLRNELGLAGHVIVGSRRSVSFDKGLDTSAEATGCRRCPRKQDEPSSASEGWRIRALLKPWRATRDPWSTWGTPSIHGGTSPPWGCCVPPHAARGVPQCRPGSWCPQLPGNQYRRHWGDRRRARRSHRCHGDDG